MFRNLEVLKKFAGRKSSSQMQRDIRRILPKKKKNQKPDWFNPASNVINESGLDKGELTSDTELLTDFQLYFMQ